jgi:hypothetical protein
MNYSYLIIIFCILLIIFLGPFVGKMQAATLWVGKKIAPEGSDLYSKNGFQDAITPKFQTNLNILIITSYLLLFIMSSIKIWYLGTVLLISVFIIKVFIERLYSNKINKYLKIIIHSMINRIADYRKCGDEMRAQAAEHMLESLDNLYNEIVLLDLPVPSILESNSMKLGNKL